MSPAEIRLFEQLSQRFLENLSDPRGDADRRVPLLARGSRYRSVDAGGCAISPLAADFGSY
jgi:hypothetical protein